MCEEGIRILSHTASHRLFRSQSTATEFSQCLLVDKGCEVFIFKHLNLLDFVRCAEAVKEIYERHTSLKGRKMSHAGKVHYLLNRTFTQHSEARLASRHYVLVVTEDTKSMRCQCTSRYVENARQVFTGNLIHIRNHKEQTL